MVNRASPADLRKALEVAHLYVKMGINFVAVPFISKQEGAALVDHAVAKLSEIERAAAENEADTASGRAQRTNDNESIAAQPKDTTKGQA